MNYTFSDHVLALNPGIEEIVNPGKGKRSKYGNIKCSFNGMNFDSKAEMKHYGDLRLLELEGHISNLRTQHVLQLNAGIKYRADFAYIENGKTVIEDVKGGKATITDSFKLKWKIAQELYPDYIFRIISKGK